MPDSQELQRLIQEAQQRQVDAQMTAKQARQNEKLALMASFQQTLEHDLSPEVVRAIGVQYEWVSSGSSPLPEMTQRGMTITPQFSDPGDYKLWKTTNIPEYRWDTDEIYVATFLQSNKQVVMGRGWMISYDEGRKLVYVIYGNGIPAVSYAPEHIRDGLLLYIDKLSKGDFSNRW